MSIKKQIRDRLAALERKNATRELSKPIYIVGVDAKGEPASICVLNHGAKNVVEIDPETAGFSGVWNPLRNPTI